MKRNNSEWLPGKGRRASEHRSVGVFKHKTEEVYMIELFRPIAREDFLPDGTTQNSGITSQRHKGKLVTQVAIRLKTLRVLSEILNELRDEGEL